MGSCASRELNNKEKEGINLKNFEFAAFVKYCEYGQYLAYQKFLQNLWKGVKDESGKKLEKWIRKGVPDEATVKVIRDLVMVDLEKAEGIYKDIQSNLPEAEFLMNNSLQFIENLVDSKYFLSEHGKYATKRVVFFLNFILSTSDLVFLPNLVQLFLWYFEESEVFYILVAFIKQDAEGLANEGSCNSTQITYYKHYFLKQRQVPELAIILSHYLSKTEQTRELLSGVIQEMIKSLCINYLSPLYYPFLLQNFVLDKFDAIIKAIVSLFGCINFKYMVNSEQIKIEIIEKFNYFRFVEMYEKVNVENILQSSYYQG